MTQVSKETAQAVAKEMDAAIRAILSKHGLEVGKTSMGYGEWFDFKVTAVAVSLGDNGVNLASKEATYFSKFGYTAYDDNFNATELIAPLGTKFTHLLKDYAFAGVDAKKRKTPIVALDIKAGKVVYFAEAIIARINDAANEKAGA
jgi:hypothetical protein